MKNQIKSKRNDKQAYAILAVTLLAAIAINLVPEMSYAGAAVTNIDPLKTPLCKVAHWFTSGTGKAVATIAVIFLGIAAFFGKVTWGLALMFAVGIFAIFGAGEIVEAIAPDGSDAKNCTA